MPTGRRIDRTAIKYAKIILCKTHNILPKWNIWSENILSGNPVADQC
jgi:hypothetical protein